MEREIHKDAAESLDAKSEVQPQGNEQNNSTIPFQFSQEPNLETIQWKEHVSEGLPDWTAQEKRHLGQELSDVLLYLIRLADRCHIDLPKAAVDKIALNATKYPALQVRGSSRKYTAYNEHSDSATDQNLN